VDGDGDGDVVDMQLAQDPPSEVMGLPETIVAMLTRLCR
jgi:hypothetical protein